MVPDLTLEVIYFNQSTDFKMEFALCGCCNVRFLSLSVKNRSEFLAALSKSVVRSRAIITVGSFNPLGQEYLPAIIAKATGYALKPLDKTGFAVVTSGEFPLPETAVPLVTAEGELGGCVLENLDQSIIMLTDERGLRHQLISDLVCPYLKMFVEKKGKTTPANQRIVPARSAVTATAPSQPAEVAPAKEPVLEPVADPQLQADAVQVPVTPAADLAADDLDIQSLVNEVLQEHAPAAGTEATEPKYTVLEQPEQEASQFNLTDFLTEDPPPEPSGKKRPRRRWLKVVISVVLVLAVLLASYFGYEGVFQPMQTNAVYSEARALYGQTWTGLPEDMLYKFGKLYQINEDLFGWLSIPDTTINLPVVSAVERSAAYYETHLFDGSVNRFGTLYTDLLSNKDDYTRNIAIYGKGERESTMLSDLKKYLEIEHYREAPTFSFDTLYLENNWKIFSVFQVAHTKRDRYLRTDFFDDAEFKAYLSELEKRSIIETNIDLNANDQLVSLVSEGGETDTIVVARRVRDGESPLVDVTGSSVNEAPYVSEPTDSSATEVIAAPSVLQEISSEEASSSSSKKSTANQASSRYEQTEMVSSAIAVKPNSSTQESSSSLISSSSVVTSSTEEQTSAAMPNVSGNLPTIAVKNQFSGKVVSGPANEIIAQILEAEMGSGYHIEALKAQAVAAYSWLLCNGAAEGKTPSAPMKTAGSRAIQAANAVAGQVAVYGGTVAQTYYYATSAGQTAKSSDIWTAQLPYLVSVDSSVDKNADKYQTICTYTSTQIQERAAELGIPLSGDKNSWFQCTYDENGLYVRTVKIGGVEKKGPYLRNTFFNKAGLTGLRSSAYTITYQPSEDKFIFTVKGYGHGVGMSQTGANAYAKNGWGYETILKHYYTGISLGTYFVD